MWLNAVWLNQWFIQDHLANHFQTSCGNFQVNKSYGTPVWYLHHINVYCSLLCENQCLKTILADVYCTSIWEFIVLEFTVLDHLFTFTIVHQFLYATKSLSSSLTPKTIQKHLHLFNSPNYRQENHRQFCKTMNLIVWMCKLRTK